MTELEVKSAVRARDGYRCMDCGLSEDDHVEQTGRALDVHRLIPGSIYRPDICVTLCRSCHGKKPRTVAELWFNNVPESSGVFFVPWNAAFGPERDLYLAIKSMADLRGIRPEEIVNQAVHCYLRDHAGSDYCI